MDFVLSGKTLVTISVVAVIGGGYYLVKKPKTPNKRKTSKVRLTDPKGCKDIIQAKSFFPPDPRGCPQQQQPLENSIKPADARARPNARLIHAFGINNCFTTGEKQRCIDFKNDAKKLVDLSDDQWANLASAVRQVALQQCSQASRISLFQIIQLITMKVALDPLLNVNIAVSDLDQTISQLAEEINPQWLRSKQSNGPETAFAAQKTLNSALSAIMPAWNGVDDTKNPLNFILPGYETLWRVVLRCFIEIVFRSTAEDKGWRLALEDFAEHPTTDQLNMIKAEYGQVSACMVVEEALRLYPPTRRIYRDFETADGEIIEAAADIEACHRNEAIWGEDALAFQPARWTGTRGEKLFKQDNFMPFGAHPFACVAKQSATADRLPFGVAMIAILVGALSNAVGNEFELMGAGSRAEGYKPLSTEREAYEELHLQRLV